MVIAIRTLEELTLNTAPALYHHFYDGWVLRASGNDTRRANSVTVLHPSTISLEHKIAHCDSWYRQHDQRPIFRLTEALAPTELDALLAARGYVRETETSVMTLALGVLPATANPLPGIRLAERTIADGIADIHHIKGSSAVVAARDADRQAQWCGQQIFLTLNGASGVLCAGMARLVDGHLGIFNLLTDPQQRGRGYASMLIERLLAWGKVGGAHSAFLQVHVHNAAAISIYRRFGFASSYVYWHRVLHD